MSGRSRRTSPRSLVQRELATSERFRTVNEIHLALADRKHRVSLSTTYRTLARLAEGGGTAVRSTHTHGS
ncbi:transcriptional repressor [Promicromonospora iranensis]|uniref:transcriptional repressor n=1 Tax=Promicromonospora iranensis TaxID=1105144 RepID=UPI003CD0C5EC